jgi:nitrogen fixation protein NifU and related proteins
VSDLSDLYQSVILDHNRSPRNSRPMPGADREAEGFNPLCGDRLRVCLKLAPGGVIDDVSFEGVGCAISQASASLMTTVIKGKSSAEALELFDRFHEMLTGSGPETASGLGKLAVFSGVREFPSRVKCASLAWHALRSALQNDDR